MVTIWVDDCACAARAPQGRIGGKRWEAQPHAGGDDEFIRWHGEAQVLDGRGFQPTTGVVEVLTSE